MSDDILTLYSVKAFYLLFCEITKLITNASFSCT